MVARTIEDGIDIRFDNVLHYYSRIHMLMSKPFFLLYIKKLLSLAARLRCHACSRTRASARHVSPCALTKAKARLHARSPGLRLVRDTPCGRSPPAPGRRPSAVDPEAPTPYPACLNQHTRARRKKKSSGHEEKKMTRGRKKRPSSEDTRIPLICKDTVVHESKVIFPYGG